MIDLAIANSEGRTVTALNAIEKRLIGIDGNGTGREGVLQRQDKMLEELASGHKEMKGDLSLLVHRSGSWDKATFYRNAKWWIAFILTLIASVIGYLSYRAKVGHELSRVPTITRSTDATVDGR